jgi:hypothetical protein
MQFCFAQFNAWEYEKTQSVSAGLAQEVVKGLISGVGWREHSWLQFRFAWSEGAWQFKALFVIAALLLIGGAATAHAWVPLLARNAWRLMGAADGAGALTKPAESSVILILVLLTTYLTAKVKTVLDHPLTVQLDTYLKLPDYGQHLGLIPILKRQIRTLCHMRIGRAREKWMIRLCRAFPSMPFRWVLRQYMRWRGRKQAQHRRLVVYVDDLDRCGTECIVQTLDAVRLVMDIPDVIVVIAIDHRIALKAVAEHYKDLADGARPREAIARDYLGKIIQLPILLSAAHKEGLELFIEEKLFPEAVDDETPTTPTGVTPTPGKTGHSTDRTEEAGAKPAGKRETGPKLPPAVVDAGPGSVSPPAQVTDEPARQRQTRPEPTVEFLQQQMQHTTTERKLFTELSRTLRITNPRQLTRLRNCYRLLKTMVAFQGRHGDGSLRLDPPRLMRLLFWHEFLGQCPQSVRDSSKQHLSTAEGQLPEPLQSVLSDVRGNKKLREAVLEAENSDIERLVKALILPHSVVESDRANAIQSKRTAKRVPGARR